MNPQINKRGHSNHEVKGEHWNLEDLKAKTEPGTNQYLFRDNIPPYPKPEFHVRHLKHDTNKNGLHGIRGDEGFRNPGYEGFRNPGKDSLLWWSLVVEPDEITAAETRLLETTYPDRTEEQAQNQWSFLWKFATSPAFMKTSRMGSYRFTFPLEEVLDAYREQFCDGKRPVMRVYSTHLYKQEVMYAVLVHSPAHNRKFRRYPLLSDDPNGVCTYKDGRFIWRSQAMSETHEYKLVWRPDQNLMKGRYLYYRPQYYVWDHVAVALHVEDQVLEFDVGRLRENLKFCNAGPVTLPGATFEDFEEAEETVQDLWPYHPSPLEEE
ncbi:uncharacterized protein LOC129116310 [Anoplopoma fimbria]|uniref:uncharacterized protein LOC129116310 n=1 Tax=Anoplopoma fimbria TaxID=229290 RepID=UPI0023EB8784|nr:uncharacterized protein LOC129116310 [Anoplopoma fimbria]